MINKNNLEKLAKSSFVMREFLIGFSKCVINARNADEYTQDPRKRRFDHLICSKGICELETESYEEDVKAIYDFLCTM